MNSGPGGTATSAAGWYPDPSGAHESRFFDTFWTDRVADRGVVSFAPLPPLAPPTTPHSRSGGRRAPKVVAGFCAAGIVAIVLVMLVHPGSESPATRLSSRFTMYFDNLTYKIKTGGTLTNVAQDARGAITGAMTVNPPLYGTGPFTGTREGSTIHFLGAQGGDYRATLGADGVLRGTYTYPSQHGQWHATPTKPVTKSKPAWPPWWLWLLLAVAAAGLLAGLVWARVSRTAGAPRAGA